jgi:hypothetical protein
MSSPPLRRAITFCTLGAYAALIVAVWIAPPATIEEATNGLPPALDASTATYRAVATVVLASGAALVALIGWSWRTRTSRPFRSTDGELLSVGAAATLLRRAILRRADIRGAEVAVQHRSGSVAAFARLDVTPDALLAEIEDHTRLAAAALAKRVDEPLSGLKVDIKFEELDLVAARSRREAAAGEQLRAA